MQSHKQENLTGRIGRWSAQHRKKAIFGWLAFVAISMVIGFGVIPQEKIDNKTAGGPGESGQAAEVLNDAFRTESAEQVLVQSKTLQADDPQFKAAVADVTERLQGAKGVDNVVGPYDDAAGQISRDGHSALVTFELPGESKTAEENVVGTLAAVDAAAKAHPELRIEEAGDASINKAALEKSNAGDGQVGAVLDPAHAR